MTKRQEPATIGERFNNTSCRNEAIYAIAIARPHIQLLTRDGIFPENITSIEALAAALEPLGKAQVQTQGHYEFLTQRLTLLLDKSVSSISTVYNLAQSALGKTDPAALESLPKRSVSRIVKNQSKALLECAAFVRQYAAAFAAAKAPVTLAEEVEALESSLTETDAAQEQARVEAQASSQALFVCRGEIYLACKAIYSAGRNVFRKMPAEKEKFAFEYLVRASKSSASTATGSTATGATATSSAATNTEKHVAGPVLSVSASAPVLQKSTGAMFESAAV